VDVGPDPSALTWTAALLAWAFAVPLYYVSKFAAVVPHEGGHAIAGKLLFQAVRAIRFGRDGGGGTEFVPGTPWLFNIFIGLAGYLGPSLFGLLAAWLLVRGQTDAVLWGSLAFLALMLLVVRGWVGWITVPALAVLIFLVATRVDEPMRGLFAHVWAWFLLIAGVEAMLVHVSDRIYQNPTADTSRLAGLTLLPKELWALALLVGAVAALVYGGGMLLRLTGG
jgi:hypothetical protein